MDQVINFLKKIITWENIGFGILWGILINVIFNWPIKICWNNLRLPRIYISPDDNNPFTVIFKDLTYVNDKGSKNYLLRLKAKNVPWNDRKVIKKISIPSWIRTRKAEKCYFWIYFFDESGFPLFQEPMLSRIGGENCDGMTTYTLPWAVHIVDIYPNHEFYLDLVIRLEGADDCYGLWHMSPYSCIESVTNVNSLITKNEANWRKTDEIWRLGTGVYKVMIEACSEGQILKKEYLELTNLPDQFKIEKIHKFKVQDVPQS